MIKFKTLSFKNFVSAGNLPITISLDHPGLTLGEGPNGSGKTTILNALYYALFGSRSSASTFRSLSTTSTKATCW